jgi:TonB family protein
MLVQDSKGKKERLARARIPSVLPPLLSNDICLFIGKPKGSDAIVNRSILERPAPVYPKDAIRDHKSGSGAFGLIISKASGRVESVRTLVSTGHEILDNAARDSLAKWRFKSDSIDKVVVPVEFKLTKRGPLGIFGL